ncbi:hypothetical protein RUMTOR_00487 [[Ruminococcus] torques ATCC 27756]|uniref:Uncharacterized protein n=1 Tax=[Ruminococcus] torques ATCC 27756 TaxID=411460 RepID=A5KJT7_9FIRM|nr:hypothetical protein RUMTOR_00487 [[Ruminococcus] torques ATCC 27756]
MPEARISAAVQPLILSCPPLHDPESCQEAWDSVLFYSFPAFPLNAPPSNNAVIFVIADSIAVTLPKTSSSFISSGEPDISSTVFSAISVFPSFGFSPRGSSSSISFSTLYLLNSSIRL